MAHMYPDPISPDTASNAESKLYKLLKEQLDDTFTVMHSVAWLARDPQDGASDGEADFVIAHPDYGVMILEVKGGQVRLNSKSGQWYSIDRHGRQHAIKDPFGQTTRSMYALKKKLAEAPPTRHYSWFVSRAVAFPDVAVSGDLRPDAPRELILDQSRLHDLDSAVKGIFEYWKGERKRSDTPGRTGIDALKKLLAPGWELESRIGFRFREEEALIKELTERQFTVLSLLTRRRRAAIVGGAGTGKTMLAVEKARRLAAEGFDTLFLCYNRNLATWLQELIGSEKNITVKTFHALCEDTADEADVPLPLGRKHQKYYDEKLPDTLMQAVDKSERRYEAIIVDEGQDFKPNWWLPLDALFKDEETGIFYVFFDDNQRIYTELESHLPIEEEPFILDVNCRNTKGVHDALGPYSHATYPTTCNGPEGGPPVVVPATEVEAREALKKTLLDLVEAQKLDASAITILTARSDENSRWHEGDRLGTLMLTWNLNTTLKNRVRVSTIHTFKGLESPVIILTELEHAQSDELIYVGLSRARNRVYVIGELPEPTNAEETA